MDCIYGKKEHTESMIIPAIGLFLLWAFWTGLASLVPDEKIRK